MLLAAGAGLGLAAVFNAPIAGAVFVLEELVRKFETRIAIAALGASAMAIWVALLLLGSVADLSRHTFVLRRRGNRAAVSCVGCFRRISGDRI